MTIKIDRELFREIDMAAQFFPLPNRTAIIEGLLKYAIGHDEGMTTFEKAKKGLSM